MTLGFRINDVDLRMLAFLFHCRDFRQYKQFKRIKTHALSELSFANGFWLSVASLLQQGGETYPKSLAGNVIFWPI
jgi:hypothetical protein